MGKDIVRLGMIGCGRRSAAYAGIVKAVPGCQLVALCDRIPALVERARKLFGDPTIRRYTDHRALLEDQDVEAVIVCTEPEYQAELSCEAMNAGKDVFSEVPAAYNGLEECWRLVLTVEQTGRRYYLGEQIRHSPLMRYWRKLVQEGVLGTILFAEGHYLHGMGAERAWRDPETGDLLTWEEAQRTNRKERTRLWTMKHPIWYGAHELSPLLMVLDDRIISVSTLETGRPSRRYQDVPFPGMNEPFPIPDLQVALMQTSRGTILRLAVGFQVPTSEHHWYHLWGTKGEVETRRGSGEPGYRFLHPDPLPRGGFVPKAREPIPWFHLAGVPPPEIEKDLPWKKPVIGEWTVYPWRTLSDGSGKEKNQIWMCIARSKRLRPAWSPANRSKKEASD